jgi:transposase
MKKVDDYEQIRKAYHIEGLTIREISRRYGHSRRLIRKTLESPIPDKYQLGQPRKSNVLGQYRQRILDLLKESEKLTRKQRYTAHKIYEILEGEGYRGCEGNIHNFICRTKKKLEAGKAYLPLEFDAGKDAQVDWGEAVVILAGEEAKVQFFVMRLNYSRVRFVKAFPFQKQEAFLDGHEAGFHFLGGVPYRITYDNLNSQAAIPQFALQVRRVGFGSLGPIPLLWTHNDSIVYFTVQVLICSQKPQYNQFRD